jgi:NADH dehydrogenase
MKVRQKFAPIHCSDLTDTIYHVISKNIYSKIVECTGPEIISFQRALRKITDINW